MNVVLARGLVEGLRGSRRDKGMGAVEVVLAALQKRLGDCTLLESFAAELGWEGEEWAYGFEGLGDGNCLPPDAGYEEGGEEEREAWQLELEGCPEDEGEGRAWEGSIDEPFPEPGVDFGEFEGLAYEGGGERKTGGSGVEEAGGGKASVRAGRFPASRFRPPEIGVGYVLFHDFVRETVWKRWLRSYERLRGGGVGMEERLAFLAVTCCWLLGPRKYQMKGREKMPPRGTCAGVLARFEDYAQLDGNVEEELGEGPLKILSHIALAYGLGWKRVDPTGGLEEWQAIWEGAYFEAEHMAELLVRQISRKTIRLLLKEDELLEVFEDLPKHLVLRFVSNETEWTEDDKGEVVEVRIDWLLNEQNEGRRSRGGWNPGRMGGQGGTESGEGEAGGDALNLMNFFGKFIHDKENPKSNRGGAIFFCLGKTNLPEDRTPIFYENVVARRCSCGTLPSEGEGCCEEGGEGHEIYFEKVAKAITTGTHLINDFWFRCTSRDKQKTRCQVVVRGKWSRSEGRYVVPNGASCPVCIGEGLLEINFSSRTSSLWVPAGIASSGGELDEIDDTGKRGRFGETGDIGVWRGRVIERLSGQFSEEELGRALDALADAPETKERELAREAGVKLRLVRAIKETLKVVVDE